MGYKKRFSKFVFTCIYNSMDQSWILKVIIQIIQNHDKYNKHIYLVLRIWIKTLRNK